MIEPRKLAAIDICLLGPTLIVIEFAVGVVLGIGLGAFILLRSNALAQQILGVYILLLGVNYIPMLWLAIWIGSRERAAGELGGELDDRKSAAAKYRRQSMYLLLPLVTPVVAIRDSLR